MSPNFLEYGSSIGSPMCENKIIIIIIWFDDFLITASVGSLPFANFHDIFGCGTPLPLQLMLVGFPSTTVCFLGNTETTGATD